MNKKNKKKREMPDSVAEGIVELILTIVFSGIGFIVCIGISKIFSVKMDDFDLDSFVLIGIAFLALIVLVISVIKTFIRRIKDKNK